MKSIIQLKTPALPLLITLTLACIVLLPAVQAVVPAPDGGYPGGNTAEGQNALLGQTTGGFNAAIGWLSLRGLTTGNFNTAVGAGTLALNNADQNTAIGTGALLFNTSGPFNTATGAFALLHNTGGSENTATGRSALFDNTTGSLNTATGTDALFSNTTGATNTANGVDALVSNTTGNSNIALGAGAGQNLTTGDSNIDIGNFGVAGEGNTIRIGTADSQTATYIAGIFGQAIDPSALLVGVDANGKLGTTTSSRRFKHDIKPMDRSSEAILAFKPVTFHYNSDAKNTPCFGLIAEEVAEVNPHLVVRDKNGEVLSVRYDAVNAMLLNEFLKEHKAFLEEHRTVQEQGTTILDFKKEIATLITTVKEQGAQIQKMSVQINFDRAAPQVALKAP